MKDNYKFYFIIMTGIFIVAAILRFWDFRHIPFTFDELSALSRTTFNNFSDLINYGVRVDGHPAGVQVFLYYWIRLFGNAEWIVKLPFLLAGLASVWIAWLIAKLWFSPTAGIFTATYIASLQLFVLYSQIARPYASGLFLTLTMVYFWSLYILKGYKIKHLVLFVLFASFSCYNHHFSLLFAAIVGVSGLWFVKPEKLKVYMFAGIAIFVLYIPHLSIFFSQLKIGGIGGWLSKPSPWFLFQFIYWLMHYSISTIFVFIVVLFFLFFYSEKINRNITIKKIRIVMLLWFLLPIVIGYAYSVFVSPVLQYSMLIFSTPYLFMYLFSYIGKTKKLYLIISVIFILIINVFSLINKREHYKILYKQPFEQVVKNALELNKKYPNDVFMIDDYLPYYNNYYFKKYKAKVPYFTLRNKNMNIIKLDSLLRHIKKNRIITCAVNRNYFQIIKNYFPYLINYNYGFTYEEYVFSRISSDSTKNISSKLIAFTNFKIKKGPVYYNSKHVETDSLNQFAYYHQESDEKFGPSIKFRLTDFTNNIYKFFDVSVHLKTLTHLSNALCVVQIKKNKKIIFWKGINFKTLNIKPHEWQEVYFTLNLQDMMRNKMNINNTVFDFFIWNPHKNDFFISNIKINMRQGNPYRYSLFYNFNDE